MYAKILWEEIGVKTRQKNTLQPFKYSNENKPLFLHSNIQNIKSLKVPQMESNYSHNQRLISPTFWATDAQQPSERFCTLKSRAANSQQICFAVNFVQLLFSNASQHFPSKVIHEFMQRLKALRHWWIAFYALDAFLAQPKGGYFVMQCSNHLCIVKLVQLFEHLKMLSCYSLHVFSLNDQKLTATVLFVWESI